MASMAEELSSQSQQLAETMSFFKLPANGEAKAKVNAKTAQGLKHEVRVAHAATRASSSATTAAAGPAWTKGLALVPKRTAIAPAERSSVRDVDFEEF
jgi:hypothetical protein